MMGALIGAGLVPATMEQTEHTLAEHFSSAVRDVNIKALGAGANAIANAFDSLVPGFVIPVQQEK